MIKPKEKYWIALTLLVAPALDLAEATRGRRNINLFKKSKSSFNEQIDIVPYWYLVS